MSQFIDFTDRELLERKLNLLEADTPAQFGIMSPQHMVEHLTLLLEASNGKKPLKLAYPEEKAAKVKAYFYVPENEITIGFRAPILPVGETLPLVHNNLDEAKADLWKNMQDFDTYFQTNPDSKPENPTMGPLTHDEWIIFHTKHFTHHFKQFGLH
tara:strand:+ start:213 stop:680 length:468 start_codon:yes stop_codon:yes gene_type:complete